VLQRSTVTDRRYEADDMVCITNPVQIAKYLMRGATMYDLLGVADSTTGSAMLVAMFSRRETRDLYKLWKEHQL